MSSIGGTIRLTFPSRFFVEADISGVSLWVDIIYQLTKNRGRVYAVSIIRLYIRSRFVSSKRPGCSRVSEGWIYSAASPLPPLRFESVLVMARLMF